MRISFLVCGLLLALAPMALRGAEETLVDAAAFGVKGDGKQDNSAALIAAAAACQGKPHPRLVLPPGTYRIERAKLPPNRRVFDFKDVDDLTIDGQGATLLFDWGHASPFSFLRCRRLTLRNIKVDWERVPFSQGKVVAATDNSFDVQVDPEYPVTGSEKIQALMDYDAETRLPLANLDVFGSAIESAQLVAPQRFHIVFKPRDIPEKAAHLSKYVKATLGRMVVLRHEVYGSFAIDLVRCEDVRLEHVSIYACPGMGIHASMCRNITCEGMEVRPKPGSGRLMSTTADCQYYTFCEGKIELVNGDYENNGDDGLNITQKYRVVQRLAGPKSLVAGLPVRVGWMGPPPAADETLVFCDNVTMASHGEAVVRSGKMDVAQRQFAVEFAAALPAEVREGDLFYSKKYLPQAVVRHCIFRGQRSRSLLFSTHDVLVEDCTVEGSGYCGIFFKGGERHGAEGPVSQNVTVRRCTFDSCGGAAIYAYGAMSKPERVTSAAGSNYTFEENTVRRNPALAARRFAGELPLWMHWSAGFAVRGCHDLKIEGNTFQGYANAVFLDQVERARIVSNRADTPAPVVLVEDTTRAISADGNTAMPVQAAAAGTRADIEYINDMR